MTQERMVNKTMGTEVQKFGLKVGQWVKFSTDRDLNTLSENQKKIYHNDQIFLVLRRNDYDSFDRSRRTLIDESGTKHDYCPRMDMLNLITLQFYQITAFSNIEIETIYGREKILKIYNASLENLLDRNFGNPPLYADIESRINKIKTVEEKEKKPEEKAYTEGATVGAFLNKKWSPEISVCIASFFGRRDGGRLAQTCKLSVTTAEAEKEKKLNSMKI